MTIGRASFYNTTVTQSSLPYHSHCNHYHLEEINFTWKRLMEETVITKKDQFTENVSCTDFMLPQIESATSSKVKKHRLSTIFASKLVAKIVKE